MKQQRYEDFLNESARQLSDKSKYRTPFRLGDIAKADAKLCFDAICGGREEFKFAKIGKIAHVLTMFGRFSEDRQINALPWMVDYGKVYESCEGFTHGIAASQFISLYGNFERSNLQPDALSSYAIRHSLSEQPILAIWTDDDSLSSIHNQALERNAAAMLSADFYIINDRDKTARFISPAKQQKACQS